MMTPTTQENDFSGTTEQRVERLIFYATRHSMLMTTFSESLSDVRVRLQSLEEDRARRAVSDAVSGERDKRLIEELSGVKKEVASMKGIVTKAVGLALATVLLAVIKWVLDGNLTGT